MNTQVGDAAPDFSLKDQKNKIVKLSTFKGKKPVVLFFYPKDDTPGCTKGKGRGKERREKGKRRVIDRS